MARRRELPRRDPVSAGRASVPACRAAGFGLRRGSGVVRRTASGRRGVAEGVTMGGRSAGASSNSGEVGRRLRPPITRSRFWRTRARSGVRRACAWRSPTQRGSSSPRAACRARAADRRGPVGGSQGRGRPALPPAETVPAIPAAVRRLETDVAAGRTLHCTVLMASADDGSEVASSVRWISASLSASARFDRLPRPSLSGAGRHAPAVREVARACRERSLARGSGTGRRARPRAHVARVSAPQPPRSASGAGKPAAERDGQNARCDERGRAPR